MSVFLAMLLAPVVLAGAEQDHSGWFLRSRDPTTQELLTLGRGGAYQASTVSNGLAATSRGRFSRLHRYLVGPSRLSWFCAFAWMARGRSAPLFPQMVFYRPKDEGEAFPKSLPVACTRTGRGRFEGGDARDRGGSTRKSSGGQRAPTGQGAGRRRASASSSPWGGPRSSEVADLQVSSPTAA